MWRHLLIFSLGLSSVAAEPRTACVRNDLKGGTNTCEGGIGSGYWTYLYNADPNDPFEVCARKRPDHLCDAAPDSFVRAVANPTLERVCVQNFATSLGDLCRQSPEHYSYILVDGPSSWYGIQATGLQRR